GVAEFKNNLIIGPSADGGNGTITANGTGAQAYSVNASAPRSVHLIVNKTSGALTPDVGTTALTLTKFSLISGDFTAPSGNFKIGGMQTTATIFNHSGGTFTHNNGRVIFDPQISPCVAGTYTIDVLPATLFYNVTIDGVQACGTDAIINSAIGDVIVSENDFVHNDGIFNGAAEFQRDFYVNAGADGGTGTITATGNFAQTYNAAPSVPRTAHLRVNKTGNTLQEGAGTTSFSVTRFSILDGTFIAPSASFNIGGRQLSGTIFTQTGGNFNHNNSNVVFDPQMASCTPATYTVDVLPTTWFNNVNIKATGLCGGTPNITTPVGDTINILMDLIHNDGYFNGLAAFHNNLIVNAGADGGTGSYIFSGVADQTYNISTLSARCPNVKVNKGTGTVTADATTDWRIRGFEIIQGSFDAPTGTLNLTHYFGNSGVFNHNNATVLFAGNTAQVIFGTTITSFYNFTLNNAANSSLNQNAIIENNLTFLNGRFNVNAKKLTLNENCTITGATSSRFIQSNGLASGQGVEKLFNSGTANFTFPIGTSSRYTPVNYNITANSAPGSIRIQPVTGAHPNTTNPANSQLNFYWKVFESGFSGLTVTHQYNYIQADVTGAEGSYVAGRFLAPTWTPLGGIAGTVNASLNTITLTNVNYLVGDYTAGATTEFQNTPAVVIASTPSGTICQGTTVNFTATPTNGGATPTYQWQINGVNVGSGGNTYSTSSLNDGDVVTCWLTSSLMGAYPNPVESNALTFLVNPSVTPTISVSANPGSTVCNGSSITFTASITNGGSSPSFQWKRNGVNVGTNSPTYTLVTPVTGDIISCVLTSNADCRTSNTATSSGITITVNPAVTATINITANPPGGICTGTSVTFTAATTNGGATPTYHWKLNGNNVGANLPTYTHPSLSNGAIITCELASSITCAAPVVSNVITMTVGNILAPSISITADPSDNVCSGTSVTFNPTPVNGGASPSYEWFLNGVSQGVSPTFVSNTLVTGDYVNVEMTSSLACAVPTTANSNTITMTVNPTVSPTISIAGNQNNLCTSGYVFTSSITNGGATPTYQWKRNGVNVGTNSPTFTANNLLNGDVITCEMASSLICPVPTIAVSNSIVINLTGAVTNWLGLTSDWSVGSPLNWDNGYPSSNTTAVISTGTPFSPVINGSVECFNLVINTGASLTVNGVNQLAVYGRFINDGTFNSNFGSVEFLSCSGSTAQPHEITTNTGVKTTFFNLELNDAVGLNLYSDIDLVGTLTLTNGTFTNTGEDVVFLSTASGTARLAAVPTGANYVGNITMQRFAPGPITGWAQLGTPIIGSTIAQWQDDFATSGFLGSTGWAGGFISVYTYDETVPGFFDAPAAYVPATNVTNNVPVGKGFWVYLGTGFGTTSDITIDVTGQPHIGDFDFGVTFTNSGFPDDDGYSLIANPYPSAINWDSPNWTKTNINDAIYMYQADNGQYASYVGGVATNGGSKYIASSQGFFIQANAAAPVLRTTEGVKTSANPVLIKEAEPLNIIRIKVEGNDVNDETVVRLTNEATVNFDGSFDAKKMASDKPQNPTLSSVVNGKDLSINSLPFSGNEIVIPIRLIVGIGGMYQFTWTGTESFAEGSCFVLEDLDKGIKTVLEEGGSYYFNANIGYREPRFLLHINTPLPYESTNTNCSNANSGSITVTNAGNTASTVKLLNYDGTVKAVAQVNGSYTFDNLAEGTYQLSYPSSSVCGDVNQTIVIGSDKNISAQFEVSAEDITVDQSVVFTAKTGKNSNVKWDFGDGTIVNGQVKVTHQYNQAGNYTVSLYNENGDCNETETIALQVKDRVTASNTMNVTQRNGSYYAEFDFNQEAQVDITIINSLGQEIAETQHFTGKKGVVKLNLDGVAEGIYYISMRKDNELFTKKIVK
ncbi:MAG: PKD domain-containing protein, partial [Bacteroidia bacterium]|nr:PKD domain-containing protein [Bacteroidia bacterium]